MASDGIDPVSFGTGASGLAPATITYGSLNLQPLMTAMQQRMRNAQNARENELALQSLALKEKLAQDEMQLKRDQFEAEGPLRAAQIENYHALANYHNRMGKAQADAITKQWQYNASLAPELANYNQEMIDLNNQFDQGSEDWWLGKNAVENKYAQILATDPGMKAQNMWDTRGQRASVAIAQAQQRTAQSLNDVASKYAVPMESLGALQQSVDRPIEDIPSTGGFQASAGGAAGNVWGTNADGSRYAYFPYDPNGKVNPTLPPIDLGTANALKPEDLQKDYRKVVIQAPQVESIVAASRALNGPLTGSGVAPRWAYTLRGRQPAQQERVRRYNPATGKYEVVTP